MKHALQYCQENFKDHNIAFYFFNARGRSLEKSPLGMLRSLVVQLLEQDPFLSDAFIPTFLIKKTRHRASEWRWKTGELKEFLLMEYQRHHDKPTLLIIDALDECSDSDVQEVVDFLEDLSEYAIQSSSNLRICLSSRHYPTIDMKKKIELVVEQQAKHDRDISRYVQSKLITTNKYIQKRILEKSQHIFIWVVLVVHLLNMEFNRGQIKAMWTRLDEIPDDMDELFLEILERKDSEDGKKMTLLLFQWVLFAVQPLKPTQLYFAVLAGTDPPELGAWDRSQVELETIDRFITSCSKGLVEIRPKVNYYTGEDESGVQFIHQSVIDCLTRNHRISRLDLALGSTAAGTSHSRLASCCMAYIMQQDLESLTIDMSLGVDATKVKESYPLLEYASMNLLTHAENAQADGITQVSLLQQLEDHRGYEILRKLHDIWTPDVYKFKETRLLYALSLYGCDSLVRALLHDRGADVNAQGGFYDTALQAAAAFGSTTIVTLLLDCGADVNAQGGHYNTALQAAAAVGSTAIVTLLLDRGADINADGGYYNTALQAAAAVYDSIDLVTLLLDRGADVNAQGGYYGNALQAAATEYDSMATITLLLDRGADVNAQGGYYGNALQAAAVLDNLVTVTLLLDRGADVNAHGGLYETALQAATERCKGDLRMLLLEWGALEP
jgi:ankyrin repeat protein